jgi:hypothetical protein
MTFVPRWIHKYKGKAEYGRWVEAGSVYFGQFMNWVPVNADEACTIVGWCGPESVVFTETRKEMFFAEPSAAVKDARVARRIAEQEASLRLRIGDVDVDEAV